MKFSMVTKQLKILHFFYKMCLVLQAEYQKDAEKMMHHHNLPLDYPEFVRAKETAKNASDVSAEYTLR